MVGIAPTGNRLYKIKIMNTLKSLWTRRGQYGWISIEIIVASAIAFFVLDSIVVSTYDASRPYNYDVDRLVMVQVSRLDQYHPDYDDTRMRNLDVIEGDIMSIIPGLAELPEVEKAIPLPIRGFGGGDDSRDDVPLAESLHVQSFKATFIPETEFFTTMGIKAASDIPGNPSIEQMNDMWVNFYDEMICTRMEARLLHGDEYTAMAKSREAHDTWHAANPDLSNPIDKLAIVGIVEDIRAWGDRPWPLVRFYADPLYHSLQWNNRGVYNILLRLKKRENAKSFAHKFNHDPELQKLARSGVLEFNNAKAYAEFNGADTLFSPKERYRNLLVVFFAINIFLGVFGTFWMLTRKRAEEAGIMRAFGATPLRVRLMLYVEGSIIALVSSLTGCAIYVYYLSKNPDQFEYGLSGFRAVDIEQIPAELHSWVGDFWAHSAVVSAVVCGLMLIVVLLGIAIPAWKLSHINPVEALAEE